MGVARIFGRGALSGAKGRIVSGDKALKGGGVSPLENLLDFMCLF